MRRASLIPPMVPIGWQNKMASIVDILHTQASPTAPNPNFTSNGQHYINANNLYESRVWPALFKNIGSKQSKHMAVIEHTSMVRGSDYLLVLPKRRKNKGDPLALEDRPYEGDSKPKQAHALVALDYLLTCPQGLQRPPHQEAQGHSLKGFY